MFRKIDTWIGKHLFIPLIIRACQKFKISQDEFATYAFICFTLLGFWYWKYTDWTSGVQLVILILYGIFFVLKAGLRLFTNPSKPSSFWYQLRWINYLTTPPVLLLCIGDVPSFVEITLKALMFHIALFAKEITTIPPTEIKKKKKQETKLVTITR